MTATATNITELATYKTALLNVIKTNAKFNALACAHVRAKHGHFTVPAFCEADDLTDSEKLATLKQLVTGLAAAHNGKPHGLLGEIPAGQAKEPKEEAAPKEPPKRVTPDFSAPPPKAAPPAPEPKPVPVSSDPFADRLKALILEVVGPIQAEGGKLDEERVKEIANNEASAECATLGAAIREREQELRESFNKTIADAIAKAVSDLPPKKLEVGFQGKVNTVEGITHRQLPEILAIAASNVPLWLWGAAGGGKTTIGAQVAKGLGLSFTCVSVDETMTVGKLIGFKNLATGEFVEGLLYRVFKEGGVLLLDEIDTNATAMCALNAMLANGHYTFGNGEYVARHENFRVLAGANTNGKGATAGYTARVRLDAATLDRFAVMELAYDWEMVERITGKSEWGSWVKRVSLDFGKSVLISPRAAILGDKLLRAGITAEKAAEMLLFKLVAPDTKANILAKHPLPANLTPKEAAA